MIRFAVLAGLTAFIWFVLNDGPGATKSTPAPVISVPVISVPVISVPLEVVSAAPTNMIFAQAQIQPLAQAPKIRKARAPARITVYSAGSMVRHCVDWYAEERRPSGTVIVPRMRCRWARR